MTEDFNQQVIQEFRANKGVVGGPFTGARLLLLTTTGARSGAPHTVPLGYLPGEENERYVIASAGGSDRHPAWFHNLRAHPQVTMEDGVFTLKAEATVVQGAERDRVFARAAEADPGWQRYQDGTSRVLPVVRLDATDGGPPAGRFGDALMQIHQAFRRELSLVRAEVAATGGATLGAQLRINCLALCQGLEYHHTMEDQGMFPGVEQADPGLAPVVARLREEHGRVAELIGELHGAVAGGGDGAAVLAEVERLAAELEAHLDHEEEQLVEVLNGLSPATDEASA